MGTGNLTDQNDGEVADAQDVQQLIDAAKGDVVPRNSSGVPTDVSGNMGTSLLRWATGYFQKLIIGVSANNVSIEESSSALQFKIASVIKSVIDSSGFDGSYIKTSSIDNKNKFATGVLPSMVLGATYTSGTGNVLAIPSGVKAFFIEATGGGGGGGGGGGSGSGSGGGGGGGGGAGATINRYYVPCPSGGSMTIDIGSGGSSGTGGSGSSNGNNGGNGTDTTVSYSGDVFRCRGARGGLGGQSFANGQAGGNGAIINNTTTFEGAVFGGDGGDAPFDASNGQATGSFSPGVGGSGGGGTGGGGGGGGGASFWGANWGDKTGANGGNGGLSGGDGGGGGTAAYSAGGGGGGGAGSGTSRTGGNGGTGGPGWCRIWWVI